MQKFLRDEPDSPRLSRSHRPNCLNVGSAGLAITPAGVIMLALNFAIGLRPGPPGHRMKSEAVNIQK